MIREALASGEEDDARRDGCRWIAPKPVELRVQQRIFRSTCAVAFQVAVRDGFFAFQGPWNGSADLSNCREGGPCLVI